MTPVESVLILKPLTSSRGFMQETIRPKLRNLLAEPDSYCWFHPEFGAKEGIRFCLGGATRNIVSLRERLKAIAITEDVSSVEVLYEADIRLFGSADILSSADLVQSFYALWSQVFRESCSLSERDTFRLWAGIFAAFCGEYGHVLQHGLREYVSFHRRALTEHFRSGAEQRNSGLPRVQLSFTRELPIPAEVKELVTRHQIRCLSRDDRNVATFKALHMVAILCLIPWEVEVAMCTAVLNSRLLL